MRLIIVRGLPGSGKSTFAKSLNTFHVEADMYHLKNGIYSYNTHLSSIAHSWCLETVKIAMFYKMEVIVSNTFTKVSSFEKYIEFANFNNYDIRVITMKSNYGSIHNVPEDIIKKMAEEWEIYDGEEYVECKFYKR